MDDRIAQALQPRTLVATDHVARLEFVDATGIAAASVWGTVEGPFCDFARTLTTTFAIDQSTRGVTIVDPCYWTPELPFLYRLRLEAELPAGPRISVDMPIGLRRWEVAGPNLRLERKRIVLRGAAVDFEELISLALARACEIALMVKSPSDVCCENASRIGVPLIVDLREDDDPPAALRRLAWQSAVLIALLDAGAPATLGSAVGGPLLVARAIRANEEATNLASDRSVAAIAVELAPGERPAAWLARCGKPVIAIRHGVSYASFNDARSECDYLQAQLAPEFNLAGYSVSRR